MGLSASARRALAGLREAARVTPMPAQGSPLRAGGAARSVPSSDRVAASSPTARPTRSGWPRAPRPRAHRVRRHGGLGVAVAQHVDQDAPAALRLAELGGERVGVALGQQLGERRARTPSRPRSPRGAGSASTRGCPSSRSPGRTAPGRSRAAARPRCGRRGARRRSRCRAPGRGRSRGGRAGRCGPRARARRAA